MTNFDKFKYLKDQPKNDVQRDVFASRLIGDLKKGEIDIQQAFGIIGDDEVLLEKFNNLNAKQFISNASIDSPEYAIPGNAIVNSMRLFAYNMAHHLKRQKYEPNYFCMLSEKNIYKPKDKCLICPFFGDHDFCVDSYHEHKQIKISAYLIFSDKIRELTLLEKSRITYKKLQVLFSEALAKSKQINKDLL